YGVGLTGAVATDDLSFDDAATRAERERRRAQRGAEPFFDRGPGYERHSGGPSSAEVDWLAPWSLPQTSEAGGKTVAPCPRQSRQPEDRSARSAGPNSTGGSRPWPAAKRCTSSRRICTRTSPGSSRRSSPPRRPRG